jgi:hypothetical protein
MIENTNTNNQVATVMPKTKFKLICASKCKKFALDFAAANRAKEFTSVSEDFLISCEAALKIHIQSRIKSHPSKGKTLM